MVTVTHSVQKQFVLGWDRNIVLLGVHFRISQLGNCVSDLQAGYTYTTSDAMPLLPQPQSGTYKTLLGNDVGLRFRAVRVTWRQRREQLSLP